MRHENPGDRLRRHLERGEADHAFALLLRSSDRLRGYLRLRYEPWLGGPVDVELVVLETLLAAVHEPEALDELGRAAPRGKDALELALFRLGLATVQRRLADAEPQRRNGHAGSEDERRAAQARLAERVERLDPPLREVARLDLEHGGRAPLAELTRRLDASPADVLARRARARELIAEEGGR